LLKQQMREIDFEGPEDGKLQRCTTASHQATGYWKNGVGNGLTPPEEGGTPFRQ
jgi:hypothetical protein